MGVSKNLVGLSIIVGTDCVSQQLPMPAGPRALVRYFGRLHLSGASNQILSNEKN